jgi:hypothetical protein
MVCSSFLVMPPIRFALAQGHSIQLWVSEKEISIDGKTQSMDVAPFIQDSRTLVPVRFVSEALGAKVDWYQEEKKAVIVLVPKVVTLWVGKDQAFVNGVEQKLDVPAVLVDNRTFVPLRFVSERLGAKVEWSQEKQQVSIDYSPPAIQLPSARSRPKKP